MTRQPLILLYFLIDRGVRHFSPLLSEETNKQTRQIFLLQKTIDVLKSDFDFTCLATAMLYD